MNDQSNLFKVKDFDQLIRDTSQKLFYPSREVSIDEAMVPFKGRHKMRQFVERKRHPTGFKCWVQLWTKVFVLTFFVYFILSDPDKPYDPGYGYGILVQ
jgi:hypothetical protein